MPDAIAPDGSLVYFRVVDATRASLVEVELPQGGVSRPVLHRTVEEIWYFLSGKGRVWLRSPDGATDTVLEVEAGATIRIPTRWSFQFGAGAGEALRFLCFTSPPWPGAGEAVGVEDGGLGPATV